MLAGIDPLSLDLAKFCSLTRVVATEYVSMQGAETIERWLAEEDGQDRRWNKDTWGSSPDAIAGQEAMMRIVGH